MDNNSFTINSNFDINLSIPIYLCLSKSGLQIDENEFKDKALEIRDILIENKYILYEYNYRYRWGMDESYGEYVVSLGGMPVTNDIYVNKR